MKGKKVLIIFIVIIFILAVVAGLIYYLTRESRLKKELITLTEKYYNEYYYPFVGEDNMQTFKELGVNVSLKYIKEQGYDTTNFDKYDCDIEHTYGVVRFTGNNLKDNYEVKTILSCSKLN